MNRKINFAHREVLVYESDTDKRPVAFEPFFWDSIERSKLHYAHLPFHSMNKKQMEDHYGITFPVSRKKLEIEHKDLYQSIIYSSIHYPLIDTHVEHNTIQNFLDRGENMLIPIITDSEEVFKIDHNNLHIDDYIIKYIKEGRIKLMLTMHHEGHFHQPTYIDWVNKFCDKFNLTSDEVYFVNSNLHSDVLCEQYEKITNTPNRFTVITTPYFEHRPWFLPNENCTIHKIYTKRALYSQFFDKLENNTKQHKKSKFLCFNRRLDAHRVLTVAQLKSNEHTVDHIASLGTAHYEPHEVKQYYGYLEGSYDLEKLTDSYRVKKKAKELLDIAPIEIDGNTYMVNYAENLNEDLHTDSFVNIVTESLFGPTSIFFSEKIYKPMYCAQPFIMVGNPFSLKKLREQGYRTFDKWWDESYDEEVDFIKRMNKLEQVYEFIGKKTYEELRQMLFEMEEVLMNNFNVLMSSKRLHDLVDTLEDLCESNTNVEPTVNKTKSII